MNAQKPLKPRHAFIPPTLKAVAEYAAALNVRAPADTALKNMLKWLLTFTNPLLIMHAN